MKTFSPSEAAFEGFRLIRDHPAAILAWTAATILVQLTLGALVLGLFGSQLSAIVQASADGAQGASPAATLAMMQPFILIGLLAFPVGLFVLAVFFCAVFRVVLGPADKGWFYLKLGADEGRQVLLYLAWIGIVIVGYVALILAVVIIALVLALVFGALAHGGSAAGSGGLAPRLIGVGAGLAVLCALIWVMVRFSLAAPMTFAEKRVRVFGSWRLTKGRFWSLFGCYVLSWVFGLLIGLLGWIVSMCLGAVITGSWSGLSAMMVNPRAAMLTSGVAGLAKVFTVAGVVQIVVSSLIGIVSRVIMYAPVAAAYRALVRNGDPVTSAPIGSGPTSPWGQA